MVFHRIQDARCIGEIFRGVHRAAVACVRAARHPVLGQCHSDGGYRVALYLPRRRKVGDMDRPAEEFLPDTLGGALHSVHRPQP